MPAARGVKRTASKTSTATTSAPQTKKRRGALQLEIPTAPQKRGRVLACGQGDVGQLGLGEDVIETTKFKHVAGLGDKIVDVHAGGMHTIALDFNGKIWTFGCNDEGALGRATTGETDEGKPKTVTLPGKAVRITAGDSHSAALLENGDVYAWGSFRDSHGSMGLVVRGREAKPCRDPVKVDVGEPCVDIVSGGDHLALLTTSGSVFTMGCGEQGQLGRLSQRSATREARQGFNSLLVPSKVTVRGGASRVWAGYHATFVLSASTDKMLAFGLNNYGQLGITGEKRKAAIFAPMECDAFTSQNTSWKSISCGQHHSLALDSSGQVYAIGRCEYGRLGLGDRTGDAEILEPIPKLQNKKCISIAAGTSNSFAVTDSGEVFAWGMGSEGQLGTGGSSDASEPTPAVLAGQTAKPVGVSAGGQHTILLLETKEADLPEEMEVDAASQPNQEEEVSSSSTVAKEPEEPKPQKLNGDENKETEMEVDENDKTDAKEKKEDDQPKPEQTDEKTATEPLETDSQTEPEKPETTDTSSQDTESDTKSQPDSDTKSQDSDTKSQDSEKGVNGTPETVEPKETKTVEAIPSANVLTTTA